MTTRKEFERRMLSTFVNYERDVEFGCGGCGASFGSDKRIPSRCDNCGEPVFQGESEPGVD